MLKWLRNNRNLKLVIFIGFAILFTLWGVAGTIDRRQAAANVAGTLYGQKVTLRTFLEQQQVLELVQRLSAPAQTISPTLLQNQVWLRLMLLEEARRRRLVATDAEVVATIQRIGFLQESGQFSRTRYERFLAAHRITPRQFEEYVRGDLLQDKLRAAVFKDAQVDEPTARETYNREHERVQLRYVAIPATRARAEAERSAKKLSTAALKDYYTQHPDAFKTEPRTTIAYVHFPSKPADPAGQVPTVDAVQNALTTDKRSLEDVAHGYQLEVHHVGPFTGTDIPDVQLPAQLETFIVGSAVGQPTPAVPVEDGFLILVVTARQEAVAQTFEQAQPRVRERLIAERAAQAAQAFAAHVRDEMLAAAQSKKSSVESVLRREGLRVVEPPPLTAHDALDNQLSATTLIEAARTLQPGTWSAPVKTGDHYVLVSLVTIITPDDAQWTKDRDAVMTQQRTASEDKLWQAFLEDAYKRSQLQSLLQ